MSKHALVVAGQKLPETAKAVAVVSSFLSFRGFIVQTMSPVTGGEVAAQLSQFAATSCNPATQPPWSQFLFYFIGHGGGGQMELQDARGMITGFILTDEMAKGAFAICVDEWTFVFDMCQAFDAVSFILTAAAASGKQPPGWILTASGSSSMQPVSHSGLWGTYADFGRWVAELRLFGLGRDVSTTRDESYSYALDECLRSGLTLAADLDACLWQKRFRDPWWWNKSVTGVTPLDYSQTKDVPVF